MEDRKREQRLPLRGLRWNDGFGLWRRLEARREEDAERAAKNGHKRSLKG